MNTQKTQDGAALAPVGGSAPSPMMDRRAAAIHRVFRALDTGEGPARDDVELAMDEIIALRKEREKQAATIRHMESRAEDASDDSYLGEIVAFDCREKTLGIQLDQMPGGKPGHKLGARAVISFLPNNQGVARAAQNTDHDSAR